MKRRRAVALLHASSSLALGAAVALATGCLAPASDEPPAEIGVDTVAPALPVPPTGADPSAESGQPPVDGIVTQDTTVTTGAAEVAGPGGADPGADTPGVGATPQEPTGALEARLERIAAAQERLAARMDSLSARSVGGGGPSADAGQVLGRAGEQVRSFGVGVVWALLVLVLFNYVIWALVWVLDHLAERSVTRRLFYKKLVPITRILLWIFAAYLIVRVIFQVTAQGILAAAAAVGVAVGFAAQDLLKNLFGGIILVFDQPFQVGDKISAGGTYGEVKSIGLRSTRIVTPDDNLVSVPNAQVVDGQVANANAGELNCQVVTDLYLPGWTDEAKAKKIAFEAAASSKYVYLNKPIVVLVKDEFKETFLTHLKVKAYVLDPRYEFLFQSDVTERARAGFREAGLTDASHGLRAYLDPSRLHPPPAAE
jgi:small-conductance mechanosensitive channel